MKGQDKQREKLYAKRLIESFEGFTEASDRKYFDIYSMTIFRHARGRVLDVGCGTGIHSRHLSSRGYEAYAFDISPEVVLRSKRMEKRGGLRFVVADAECMPFSDGSFDYVFCGALLHHIPDRKKAIEEIRRVLKPRGRVFSFDPNRKNPYTFLSQNIINRFFGIEGLSRNERSLSPKMLKDEFSRAGFGNFQFQTLTMYSKKHKGVVSRIRPIITKIQLRTLPKTRKDNMLIMECQKSGS